MSLQLRLRKVFDALIAPAPGVPPVAERARATVMLLLEVAWADHEIRSTRDGYAQSYRH